MSNASHDSVASRWVRLGALINVEPARATPDLERLLLDTVRAAPSNSRLFVVAASWLASYGDFVAKHRLTRLIDDELEHEHRPTLGFLLEWAKERTKANAARFNRAIAACVTADLPRPLSDVERATPAFSRLAEQRASALSRKWGRWLSEFDVKENALRPAEWIAARNPSLAIRALTGGDLVASVLAECEAEPGMVESETELARRCGGSRPAVIEALRRLQLGGFVRMNAHGRSVTVERRHPKPLAAR
jgi:hypothetical protein